MFFTFRNSAHTFRQICRCANYSAQFLPDFPQCGLQQAFLFTTVHTFRQISRSADITPGLSCLQQCTHFPPDFPQCRYYPGAVLFATVHTLPARFPAVQILPRGCPVCWNTWGPPGANLDFKHIKIPPVFPGHCLHFAARGGNCRLNCNKGGAEGVKNGTK